MPIPEPERSDADESEHDRPLRVAGTVRLMTEDPFEVHGEADSGLAKRLTTVVADRPWLIPAVLLGLGVAFLALRRRR